jgi:hypothetical protein
LMPVKVSHYQFMDQENLQFLFLFDAVFVIDRILDLFVSYYNPNGMIEHKLHSVILNNISIKLFLEIFISIMPLFVNNISAFNYALFKIYRYGRLFEMDSNISNIIE